MKYPVIFLTKTILTIFYYICALLFVVAGYVINLIWNFKWGHFVDFDSGFWRIDNNSEYIPLEQRDPKLIYKNPIYWLFNGNFKNLN